MNEPQISEGSKKAEKRRWVAVRCGLVLIFVSALMITVEKLVIQASYFADPRFMHTGDFAAMLDIAYFCSSPVWFFLAFLGTCLCCAIPQRKTQLFAISVVLGSAVVILATSWHRRVYPNVLASFLNTGF